MASLFKACKDAARNQAGGTFNIGGYDIELELYHQRDIDSGTTLGDNDESKIVVVADDTITIPSGYTLTPNKPKKSLVILCNTLVNNGTISMYQKAPNVLPHDYYIIEGSIVGSNRNIIIPAYANNSVPKTHRYSGINGNNGTNRNCGSGGLGKAIFENYSSGTGDLTRWIGASGSGYAFGGGAGSGGAYWYYGDYGSPDVDSVYPMRGGAGGNYTGNGYNQGGVGNPKGNDYFSPNYSSSIQDFGCGGRIIIFCISFENNGNITVDGTNTKIPSGLPGNNTSNESFGGASGAGAVDLFYTDMITEGTITANGGDTFTKNNMTPGKGGNGSITLTQWSQSKLYKLEAKYFSQANVDYLLTQLTERIKESRMGE